MGRKVPFMLGVKPFESKGEAKKYIKDVRDNAPLNTPLEGENLIDALALLDLHPDKEQKVGSGIKHIEIRYTAGVNPAHPIGREFWIVRSDGSEDHFGLEECFNPSGAKRNASIAMRRLTAPDMEACCVQAFDGKQELICAVTHKPYPFKEAEVHHEPPDFEELADQFAGQEGGYQKLLTTDNDLEKGCHFKDPQVAERWLAFHREHAKLVVISKEGHKQLHKGKPKMAQFSSRRKRPLGFGVDERTPSD